ncbi:hypothetical protein BH23ACT10_BH23ACT10_03620 [soil metagenome]
MTVAEPLRRMLRTRARRDWTEIVSGYLADPLRYWTADTPRHADKLERKKRAVRRRDGLDDATMIAEVVRMAVRRRIQRPAPVYITGLGGTGSHWLAGMLDAATDVVTAGEVYVPRTLTDELHDLSDIDQACAIDAIHLLHAWPRSTDVWALGVINCAAGVRLLPQHARWFPNATMIHLRRDPRDQVLSVTFRKPRFRHYLAPDATDDEYLRRMIHRGVTAYRESSTAAVHIDVTVRYEELLRDPRPALRDILTALGRPRDDQRIDQAVQRHDTDALRADTASTATNLDEGGRSRSWHDLDDPACQRVLHAGLADVIHGYGYPPDDCMGSHVPDGDLPDRTLTFTTPPPGPLYERITGTWTPIDTDRPDLHVAAGRAVLLRVGTNDVPDLRVLRTLSTTDVQALCLAGNRHVGDAAMGHVATLSGLATLDIANTGVTDAGLAHLSGLDALQQVNLAQTSTTARGRADLAAQLPQLTIWT